MKLLFVLGVLTAIIFFVAAGVVAIKNFRHVFSSIKPSNLELAFSLLSLFGVVMIAASVIWWAIA